LGVGAILQRSCGGTDIVPVLPGFTGSGKLNAVRPFTGSPSTSIELAPFKTVFPLQVTESATSGLLLLSPQPARAQSGSNQARRPTRINVSIFQLQPESPSSSATRRTLIAPEAAV
jgi:hypothetical protein